MLLHEFILISMAVICLIINSNNGIEAKSLVLLKNTQSVTDDNGIDTINRNNNNNFINSDIIPLRYVLFEPREQELNSFDEKMMNNNYAINKENNDGKFLKLSKKSWKIPSKSISRLADIMSNSIKLEKDKDELLKMEAIFEEFADS
jgi:hypothetical protein